MKTLQTIRYFSSTTLHHKPSIPSMFASLFGRSFLDYEEDKHCPADAIQTQVINDRNQTKKEFDTKEIVIPRSKKVHGRYVLDEKEFPDIVTAEKEKSPFLTFLKWQATTKEKIIVPSKKELDEKLPVQMADKIKLNNVPGSSPTTDPEDIQVTWLGHACVLVQFDGWSILADPVFSHRCAPVQFAGPARVRPSPVNVDQVHKNLPDNIDAVIISHNHYDHLDEDSVRNLAATQTSANLFCTAGK